MLKYTKLIALLALLLLVGTAAAQEVTPEATPEAAPHADIMTETVLVENVEMIVSPEGALISITGVHTNGCALPLDYLQTRSGDTITIEVWQQPSDDASCVSQPVPFKLDVLLEGALANQHLINVNNYSVLVSLPQDAPITHTPQARVPVYLLPENLTLSDTTGKLIINGNLPDGCEDPVSVRQRIDNEARIIRLDVFVTQPIEPRPCPRILKPFTFEVSIALPEEIGGAYLLFVNDVELIYDLDRGVLTTPDEASGARVPMVIEAVDVLFLESFPPQVVIHVTGYQPDGCTYPVLVDETRDGNTITLDIYRILPPDIMCTMNIVGYEDSFNLGMFDPGTYTIIVNGFTVEVVV